MRRRRGKGVGGGGEGKRTMLRRFERGYTLAQLGGGGWTFGPPSTHFTPLALFPLFFGSTNHDYLNK